MRRWRAPRRFAGDSFLPSRRRFERAAFAAAHRRVRCRRRDGRRMNESFRLGCDASLRHAHERIVQHARIGVSLCRSLLTNANASLAEARCFVRARIANARLNESFSSRRRDARAIASKSASSRVVRVLFVSAKRHECARRDHASIDARIASIRIAPAAYAAQTPRISGFAAIRLVVQRRDAKPSHRIGKIRRNTKQSVRAHAMRFADFDEIGQKHLKSITFNARDARLSTR